MYNYKKIKEPYHNALNLWEKLGLDGPTCDINAIKKAYAKKAHEMNPEDDPEGFVELHNAYKAAVGMAKARAHSRTGGQNFRIMVAQETQDTEDVQESREEERSPYDFGGITPVSSDDHLNNLIIFKQENKIETEEQVGQLSRRALIIITRELCTQYAKYIAYKGKPELWREFWEEPAVKYFERDPEFRKWMLKVIHNPEAREITEEITASLARLPEEHKWFAGKDPVAPQQVKKKMNPVVLFFISVFGLFCISLGTGVFLRWTNQLKATEMDEIILISLGITLIAVILHFIEKLKRK